MSQLDSELNMLRFRIAALEEQKRIETEIATEKKAFPMKALEELIDKHKSVHHGNSDKFQNERYRNSREKLSFLQPILDALKNINERLDALEKKE
jgi:hypothetical protein